MEAGETINQRGWRHGSVWPMDRLDAIRDHLRLPGLPAAQVENTDWLVVASQTCDIVVKKLEAEPLVEILHCKRIVKTRSQFRDLRSTRRLDFRPHKTNHPHTVLTAHASADRYVIPRQLLLENNPDPHLYLDSVASQRVQGWFALRANRPSWPDHFCQRLDAQREVLVNLLQEVKDEVAQVRIGISPKDSELHPGQPYGVAVYFIVDDNIWLNEPDTRQSIQQVFVSFISTITKCEDIHLDQNLSGVIHGSEFSWQATESTDLWNFAHLSPLDESLNV